jgi:AbrB family looped-hinge helix DNA binding protein
METITVSPKFQIVIPKKIRQKLKIVPGQKLQVFQSGNRIEYVIVGDMKDYRGFLKGMDTQLDREGDRY